MVGPLARGGRGRGRAGRGGARCLGARAGSKVTLSYLSNLLIPPFQVLSMWGV